VPEKIVGEAVIVVGADATPFQVQTKMAAEKAGTGAGAGFSKTFDKEAQKGAKSTGSGFSASLSSALTKGFSKVGLVDGLTGKFRKLSTQSDEVDAKIKKVASSMRDLKGKGLSPLITAAAGLGPSLLPVLGAATIAVGAFGAALAGAGAAGGVFGAVFKSSYADVKKQITATDTINKSIEKYQTKLSLTKKGTDEYKTALKNVNLQQSMLKGLLEGMTAPEKAAYGGFDNMKTSWAKFKDQNQGQTLGLMARGFNLIAAVIPKLQPLFDVGARALRSLLDQATRWKDSGGLEDLIMFLAVQGNETLPKLQTLFTNLAVTVGRFFRAASGGPSLLDWFVKLSASASGWSASGGFERFTTAMSSLTPSVVATLGSLATSLGHIAEAVTPLAPLSAALATGLLAITNAIPVPALTALIGAYLALNLITKASLALQGIQFLSLTAWSKALKVAEFATKAWAVAQAGLNFVLSLNPIALIIIGLVALGAALFLAYKKSETFRDIVNGTWTTIKAVVGAVVDWITGTAVPWIVGAWSAISSGAVTAFTAVVTGATWFLGVVTSVFGAIRTAVVTAFNAVVGAGQFVIGFIADALAPQFWFFEKIVEASIKSAIIVVLSLWQFGVKPLIDFVTAGVKTLADIFTWLWKVAITAAYNGIVALTMSVWNNGIRPIFEFIKAGVRLLGDAFSRLWHNIITPAFNGIVAIVKFAWNNGVLPLFNDIKRGIRTLGDVFTWLWNNAVKPAFGNLVAGIKYAWSNGIVPVFDAIKRGVGKVKDAFGSAIDGIRTTWNKLEGIAKKPIKFMIGTVLNGGLIKAFNWLGSKVGGPHIDNIPMPFATGGVLPGYTPGRDVHEFYSPTGGRLRLSGGEAIMRPEFTRLVGGKAGVDALNQRARAGGGLGDFASGGVIPGFAGGGVLKFIEKAGAGAFNWVGDKASSISKAFANPLDYLQSKMKAVGGPGVIPDFANAAGKKLLTASVSKIKSLFNVFTKAFGSGGPAIKGPRVHVDGQVLDADTYARLTRAELASGIAMRVIQGSFSSRVAASMGTHSGAGAMDLGPAGGRYAGGVSALRAQGLLAMFRNWPGNKHIHSINPAVYSSMAPATQRQVKRAQANNGIFAGGGVTSFDSGGLLPKGLSLAYNGTGKPEPVGHDLKGDTYIDIRLSLDDLSRIHTLDDFLKMLENSRASSRKIRRSGVTSA
jgi:phage-related protein